MMTTCKTNVSDRDDRFPDFGGSRQSGFEAHCLRNAANARWRVLSRAQEGVAPVDTSRPRFRKHAFAIRAESLGEMRSVLPSSGLTDLLTKSRSSAFLSPRAPQKLKSLSFSASVPAAIRNQILIALRKEGLEIGISSENTRSASAAFSETAVAPCRYLQLLPAFPKIRIRNRPDWRGFAAKRLVRARKTRRFTNRSRIVNWGDNRTLTYSRLCEIADYLACPQAE